MLSLQIADRALPARSFFTRVKFFPPLFFAMQRTERSAWGPYSCNAMSGGTRAPIAEFEISLLMQCVQTLLTGGLQNHNSAGLVRS